MESILNLLIKNDNFEIAILEWVKTWDLNLENLKNLKSIQNLDNLRIFLNITNLEEKKQISLSKNRKTFLKRFFYNVEELIKSEYGKNLQELTDINFLFIFENLKKKKSSVFFIKLFLICLILTKTEKEYFFLFEKINDLQKKNMEIDNLKIFLEKTLNVFKNDKEINKKNQKMILEEFEIKFHHNEQLIKKLNFENNELISKIDFIEIGNKKIRSEKKSLIINLDKITEEYHKYKDGNKKKIEETIEKINKDWKEKYDGMYISLKKIKNKDKILEKNLNTLLNENIKLEEKIKMQNCDLLEMKNNYVKKIDYENLKKKILSLEEKNYEIENSYELEKSQVKYLQSKISKIKNISPKKIQNRKKAITLSKFNLFNKKAYGSSHTIMERNNISVTTNFETNFEDIEKELKLSTFNNNEEFDDFDPFDNIKHSDNENSLKNVNNSSRSHFLEDDLSNYSNHTDNKMYIDKMKKIEKELIDYKKNNEMINKKLEKSNLDLKKQLEESEKKSLHSKFSLKSQRSIRNINDDNNFFDKVAQNEKIIKNLKRDKNFLNKSLLGNKDYSNFQINLLYSMLLNN